MHFERFAPSPTGNLHLGHVLSSFLVAASAKKNNGKFFIRIEDLDSQRCHLKYENSIMFDLKWLGLRWSEKPVRQSERMEIYRATLVKLFKMDILYKCECTRQEIATALRQKLSRKDKRLPQSLIYPGTCKQKRILHNQYSLRLDMKKAIQLIDPKCLFFFNKEDLDERFKKIIVNPELLETKVGDVILARRDIGASYHIAVVIDDHMQRITHVTRGQDLFRETFLHVLLQNLFQFSTPSYFHHKILMNEEGNKLSKSNKSKSIEILRKTGISQDEIYRLAGLNRSLIKYVLN